jgi:hypothetical protein
MRRPSRPWRALAKRATGGADRTSTMAGAPPADGARGVTPILEVYTALEQSDDRRWRWPDRQRGLSWLPPGAIRASRWPS